VELIEEESAAEELQQAAISDDDFRVVVNHEEQYSIWPVYLAIPLGWRDVGVAGNKQHCLDYISSVWKDIRPLSVRQAD
jgi:MbtH protein